MFGIGLPELFLILVIIFIIFGAGKLPEVCSALGKGVKNFKKASQGINEIEIKPEEKDKEDDVKKIEEKNE